ncbi:MAG: orotate phosphoribosyltransferase [Flavobacteriales bacterium]|nr:orotate phosphoribosyltransferase [Flavobacteriales bacterium]|tara:strand:- start:867 stop:1511 length:645 start_codon:yes stop_codon:yes gene_type:complete
MILNLDTASKVAEYLLQAKAIKLQPKNPFTWSSGWKSPIYCDNRITLSFPPIRTFIRQELAKAIIEKYGTPDVIVGVATGAIAQGALVAEELGVPFAYVRASAKEHGLGNLIEGNVDSGQRVVVIEDLISTAGSSLKAVGALKDVGATVLGMAAIFTYNFQISYNRLKEANCELITLSDYDSLVKQAVESRYITESDVNLIKGWRLDPSSWTGK